MASGSFSTDTQKNYEKRRLTGMPQLLHLTDASQSFIAAMRNFEMNQTCNNLDALSLCGNVLEKNYSDGVASNASRDVRMPFWRGEGTASVPAHSKRGPNRRFPGRSRNGFGTQFLQLYFHQHPILHENTGPSAELESNHSGSGFSEPVDLRRFDDLPFPRFGLDRRGKRPNVSSDFGIVCFLETKHLTSVESDEGASFLRVPVSFFRAQTSQLFSGQCGGQT
jgi:hypothetical protein